MGLSQNTKMMGSYCLRIPKIISKQGLIFGHTKGMFYNKGSRLSPMAIIWFD